MTRTPANTPSGSDEPIIRPARFVGRRRFIASLGAGTIAFAVVGLSACSSDASDDGDATGDDDPTAGEPQPEAGESGGDQADGEETASSDTADSAGIAWEQVSFGFVSAYLLQRGDEIAVVDTGTEGGAGQIEAGLSALGAAWSDVGHVILTHSHGDHIGGLTAVLENAPSAMAYAGSAELEAIATDGVIGVDDGDEVFGMRVIATPGHTPGHIVVFDEASGLLVAGDALNAEDGRLTGANPQFTPDMDQANASIRKLAERNVDTVLMGHSDPVSGAGTLLTDLAAGL